MIKAVIFDMDGVIADTEPLHKRARDRLLAALGLDVEEISPTAIGRSKRAFWGEVAAKYGLTYTADELTVKEFDALMTIVREERIRAPAVIHDFRYRLLRRCIAPSVASP